MKSERHQRTFSSNIYSTYTNGRSPVFNTVYYPCLENRPGIYGSGGRNSSTGCRSGSRGKSQSRVQ